MEHLYFAEAWGMGPRLTDAAHELLRRQQGLLALWQAPRAHMNTRAVRRAARLGVDWRMAGYRTAFWGRLPMSASQLRILGCLEVGPQGMLGGAAALQEAGWQHDAGDRIDVIVPRGNRPSKRKLPSFVRLHYPRNPGTSVLSAVRCTSAARSVVDAAAWARTDREAAFAVTSALQGRLVTPEAVAHCVDLRRGITRTALVRTILSEFVGGAHSMGELDFVRECRRRGFPEPSRQVPRRDGAGKLRFTDAEFRRTDGRVVMVEVDGAGHMSADTWLADMERHNDLVLASGALVLRVSAWQLRHDPDPFFEKLGRALSVRNL